MIEDAGTDLHSLPLSACTGENTFLPFISRARNESKNIKKFIRLFEVPVVNRSLPVLITPTFE